MLLLKLIEKNVNLDGAVYLTLQELSGMDDSIVLEEFLSELLKAGANTSKIHINTNCEDDGDEENGGDDGLNNQSGDNGEDDENEDDLRSQKGDDAVILASWSGETAAVNLLLSYGASATVQNDQGRFPLLVAAQNGHKEIVEILLQNAPSTAIDMKDSYGWTALRRGSKRRA